MTRPQLIKATGLSSPTISQLVARLIEAGLVCETGEVVPSRGPGAVAYRACCDLARGVAIQIEAGQVVARVVDACDQPYPVATVRLDAQSRSETADIAAAIRGGCAAADIDEDSIVAVCIGVPSAVSPDTGQLSFVGGLPGWSRRAVKPKVEEQLGVSVCIENDANLAALAEYNQRGDQSDFALVWLGKGLRVATVVDGDVLRGRTGSAGEIGYLTVPQNPASDAAPLTCQDLIGSPAVTRLVQSHYPSKRSYQAALDAITNSALRPRLLEELAPRIATTLMPVLALLDPARIVLSGPTGVAGGPELARLVQSSLTKSTAWRVPVTASLVETHPVLAGAAWALTKRLTDHLLDLVA
jgi:predicted NBD/HSP70 family sugar kinase